MVEVISTTIDGEDVIFTLKCSRDIFRPLTTVLASLGELSHKLQHRSRCASAGIKITPERQKSIDAHRASLEKLVKKQIQIHTAVGLTFNQAVSATLAYAKEQDKYNVSHDIIRTIARRLCR